MTGASAREAAVGQPALRLRSTAHGVPIATSRSLSRPGEPGELTVHLAAERACWRASRTLHWVGADPERASDLGRGGEITVEQYAAEGRLVDHVPRIAVPPARLLQRRTTKHHAAGFAEDVGAAHHGAAYAAPADPLGSPPSPSVADHRGVPRRRRGRAGDATSTTPSGWASKAATCVSRAVDCEQVVTADELDQLAPRPLGDSVPVALRAATGRAWSNSGPAVRRRTAGEPSTCVRGAVVGDEQLEVGVVWASTDVSVVAHVRLVPVRPLRPTRGSVDRPFDNFPDRTRCGDYSRARASRRSPPPGRASRLGGDPDLPG